MSPILIIILLVLWFANASSKSKKKPQAAKPITPAAPPETEPENAQQLSMEDMLDDMTPEDMTPEPMDDLCEGSQIETMEGKDPCHPAEPMEGVDPCHPVEEKPQHAARVSERKEMQHRLRVTEEQQNAFPTEEAGTALIPEINAETLRQAFVMNEILTRPCERRRRP